MTCVTGARRNLLPLGGGILTSAAFLCYLMQQSRWRDTNGSACFRGWVEFEPLGLATAAGRTGSFRHRARSTDPHYAGGCFGRNIFLLFYLHPRNKIAAPTSVGCLR